jgi:AbrB family looped-hinge helix DNA binding protein
MTTKLKAEGSRSEGVEARSKRPSRVGPKGQVVIPKDLRASLQIEPGDEVTFWLGADGEHVEIRRARSDRPLRGRYKGRDLTGELLRERARDRRREDAK